MSAFHIAVIFVAGIAAGTINTVVGSGTLITFPTLLAFNYAPVTANVSNTIGLVPGSISGAIGYRSELTGQRERAIPLILCSICGGVVGAVLLLTLPASDFKAIVPGFIAVALLLIVFQKRINKLLANHRGEGRTGVGPVASVGSFVAGIYGGYFGAAQGILLLAIYGLTIDDELQRLNAIKIVAAGAVNLVSGIIFVFAAHVAWAPAGLIAAGSVLGGLIGARWGRKLPPNVLRGLIVLVGIIAIIRLI